MAAEGKPNQVIARELKTSRPTVILWRKRFEAGGSAGIAEDAPHGRSSRRTKDQVIKAIVETTLHRTAMSFVKRRRSSFRFLFFS